MTPTSLLSLDSDPNRPPSQNSYGYHRKKSMSSQLDNQENPMFNNILNSKRSGILLNKERENLCWDVLFMVCGGTGLTPMLQLVSCKSYFSI